VGLDVLSLSLSLSLTARIFAVAQLAAARVAGRSGKPAPPIDDSQTYALLSLALLLMKKVGGTAPDRVAPVNFD